MLPFCVSHVHVSFFDPIGLEPPPLRTFGYVSTPTVPFSDRDLSDLLRAARATNARHDVTGKLVVLEDEDGVVRFAQVIEGPEDALAVVVERIRADPRHDQIRVVVDDAMQAGRRFAGWDMAIERVPPPVFASASEALFG